MEIKLEINPYGYTSFWFDITKFILFGKKNLIAVEVKNEGQNSRWYSGSSIYQHVWLKMFSPVHIAEWGTYVTTYQVNSNSAKLQVITRLENESDTGRYFTLVSSVFDQ